MISSPKDPCPTCGAKYPHDCGIKVVPRYRCTRCNAAAYEAEPGVFRHANEPFEDSSLFCESYGYPIQVEEAPRRGGVL